MTWKRTWACRIIGVSSSAIAEEIYSAYFARIWSLRPDLYRDTFHAFQKLVEDEFILVNQAYDFLVKNSTFVLPPRTCVSRDCFEFSDVEPGQIKAETIRIDGAGGPYNSIEVMTSEEWLSMIQPQSLVDQCLPLELPIQARAPNEPGRRFSGKITVTLSNDAASIMDAVTVKVKLQVSELPVMVIEPTVLTFKDLEPGNRNACEVFTIRNAGRGTLRGEFAWSEPWLDIRPWRFDISSNAVEWHFLVFLNANAMPYGYSDTGLIHVNSNGGETSLTVFVSTLPPPPTVSVEISRTWLSRAGNTVKAILAAFGLFLIIPFHPFIVGGMGALYSNQLVFWSIVCAYIAIAFATIGLVGVMASRKVRNPKLSVPLLPRISDSATTDSKNHTSHSSTSISK